MIRNSIAMIFCEFILMILITFLVPLYFLFVWFTQQSIYFTYLMSQIKQIKGSPEMTMLSLMPFQTPNHSKRLLFIFEKQIKIFKISFIIFVCPLKVHANQDFHTSKNNDQHTSHEIRKARRVFQSFAQCSVYLNKSLNLICLRKFNKSSINPLVSYGLLLPSLTHTNLGCVDFQ